MIKRLDILLLRSKYGVTEQEFAEATGIPSQQMVSYFTQTGRLGMQIISSIYAKVGRSFEHELLIVLEESLASKHKPILREL